MEDAEIIRLVLAGHHEQYADLVQRYQEPLIHFLRHILSSEEDSLDCAQEAFLAAYRNLNRHIKEYPFRVWLYAIARNKALDLIRKRNKEILVMPDEALADQRPNPEEIVLAKEQKALFSELLHELPEQYGHALYLRYRQELSYKEIAVVLQVPVSSVKTYLHRGKEKMRQSLERREIRGE